MDMKPYQETIIKQLITQEKMLSELYWNFAEQFPQYKEFWGNLSREEDRHAMLVQKLFDSIKKNEIFFDEGKIKTSTLDIFITRLEGILQKTKNREFTLPMAIVNAADYETSLIEKNIFTHFDSLNDKAKMVLNILQLETLNHVESVKKFQQSLKK